MREPISSEGLREWGGEYGERDRERVVSEEQRIVLHRGERDGRSFRPRWMVVGFKNQSFKEDRHLILAPLPTSCSGICATGR